MEKIERDVKAALKADGFTVKQMQIADQLLSVKGEAKVTGEVEDREPKPEEQGKDPVPLLCLVTAQAMWFCLAASNQVVQSPLLSEI